ncbi:MAG: hypothetical protein H6737_01610 [Alphaproteobacteria bacterium]|nr:hypothetical protein [Alphaproteobacteria bacterium]
MFDAPPQLRSRTDLDGLHIKVSGRPSSVFDILSTEQAQQVTWLLVFGFTFLSISGLYLAAFVAAAMVVVARVLPHLEPTRGALETALSLTPSQLILVREEERLEIPWNQVGIVQVDGGSEPVISIRRAGADAPFMVPMELEPVEHAVWVAMTIEDRAKTARKQLGTAADIPRSIRRLRT